MSWQSVLFLFCVVTLWCEIMTKMNFTFGNEPRWQAIAAEKRAKTMAQIPREWILSASNLSEGKLRRSLAGEFIESLLDHDTLSITNMDVPEIAQSTSNGSLTAVQVVMAFCKRAAFAHQLVSPFTILSTFSINSA